MEKEILSERFKQLEEDVKTELTNKIAESNIVSKHIVGVPCIKVNVFDYDELVLWDGELTFIDSCGFHFSLYSECSLEDLIDLL